MGTRGMGRAKTIAYHPPSIHAMKPEFRVPNTARPDAPPARRMLWFCRRDVMALIAGLLACGVLLVNAAVRPGSRLDELKAPRRYWEDVSVGVSAYFYSGDQKDVPTIHVGIPIAMDYRHHYEGYLIRMVDELGIKPWQFWRTVPIRPSLKKDRIVPRDVDDPGRPALLAAAFRMAGAALPYLGLWLGILFACPVLLWMAWELWRADLPIAGTVLPLLIASSAFMVDILTLAYSAQAFYGLGALLLLVVSVHASLNRSPRYASLALRLLLAGSVFALSVLGRVSTMALLPAFLLAIALRVDVLVAATSCRVSRRVWAVALAIAVFMTPYAMVRQSRHHAVWGDIWEGLGDFDREYGHVWSDSVLRNVLRREGMPLGPDVGVEFENDQSEQILRRLVLGAIERDPVWYAGILARRAVATVTQRKLWPYFLWDGEAVAPASHPNEGRTDVYYSMATSVDTLALGRFRLEIPVSLMIAPTLILVLLRVFSARAGLPPPLRARLNGYLGSMLLLALGTASLPVFITTASAFEVQCFALVYFAGFAFLAEEVQRHFQFVWKGGAAVVSGSSLPPMPAGG